MAMLQGACPRHHKRIHQMLKRNIKFGIIRRFYVWFWSFGSSLRNVLCSHKLLQEMEVLRPSVFYSNSNGDRYGESNETSDVKRAGVFRGYQSLRTGALLAADLSLRLQREAAPRIADVTRASREFLSQCPKIHYF
ncbi:hypothetical protein EVAR_36078_1 [Eumeta japonica]|uniref:Uncharacterized protein n=1 Tax=Eumeta variegata TaxID=151549 RepID=A0A4C1YHY0_EUMVA|nr:hypothetical protein EVAR_36078_1 [Eumeta japonica]